MDPARPARPAGPPSGRCAGRRCGATCTPTARAGPTTSTRSPSRAASTSAADFETLFTDTRPVWTAAWIDSRESLKSAYATRSSASPDVQRRDALHRRTRRPADHDGATSPTTAPSASSIEDAGGSAEEWKARNRIEMVKAFRAHYDRVGRKAS